MCGSRGRRCSVGCTLKNFYNYCGSTHVTNNGILSLIGHPGQPTAQESIICHLGKIVKV